MFGGGPGEGAWTGKCSAFGMAWQYLPGQVWRWCLGRGVGSAVRAPCLLIHYSRNPVPVLRPPPVVGPAVDRNRWRVGLQPFPKAVPPPPPVTEQRRDEILQQVAVIRGAPGAAPPAPAAAKEPVSAKSS